MPGFWTFPHNVLTIPVLKSMHLIQLFPSPTSSNLPSQAKFKAYGFVNKASEIKPS